MPRTLASIEGEKAGWNRDLERISMTSRDWASRRPKMGMNWVIASISGLGLFSLLVVADAATPDQGTNVAATTSSAATSPSTGAEKSTESATSAKTTPTKPAAG